MKNKTYFLNTMLAAVLGAVLLAMVLVRTFAPVIILPSFDIPTVVLLSLAALLLDHYLAPGAKRCWVCIVVLGGVTFGLLPFAACVVTGGETLKLALVGGVVFAVTTLLFSSIQDRLSSGPAKKAAPLLSALGLFLASQCLMGMVL